MVGKRAVKSGFVLEFNAARLPTLRKAHSNLKPHFFPDSTENIQERAIPH